MVTTTDFTRYFRSLVTALGRHPGWYGVFAAREPAAARAFEDGTELPPWDVVRAVLHDLAAAGGVAPDPVEEGRAAALHAAAVAAWDALPGAEHALRRGLEATARAYDLALLREHEAARALDRPAGPPRSAPDARLVAAHAWARDDRERAAARRAALQSRLAALAAGPRDTPSWAADRSGRRDAGSAPRLPAGEWFASPAAPAAVPAPVPAPERVAAPRGARFAGAAVEGPSPARGSARVRAPRGARFAGAPQSEATAVAPAAPAGPAPRGARFAGAPVAAERQAPRLTDPHWTAEAGAAARRLGELRAAGHSGAAYVLLCEAATGPAERLPYLVRELERAGLGADVATMLWETAALPPDALAAAAGALSAQDRAAECRTLLHQAAARPAAELAVAAALLTEAGHGAQAVELLQALARSRPPEDAVAVARARPALTAALLDAADRVSRSRRIDIAAALRRGGLPAS